MTGLEGKIVLVTGASSGIGAEAAKHFAALKCRLSLVARNMDNLNRVAEVCKTAGAPEVIVLSKDLSITEECISAVEDTVAHFKGMYYRWCKTDPHPCISIAIGPLRVVVNRNRYFAEMPKPKQVPPKSQSFVRNIHFG